MRNPGRLYPDRLGLNDRFIQCAQYWQQTFDKPAVASDHERAHRCHCYGGLLMDRPLNVIADDIVVQPRTISWDALRDHCDL